MEDLKEDTVEHFKPLWNDRIYYTSLIINSHSLV